MSSIILDVKIDKDTPFDLYEQVASEIRRAIADGEAKAGDASLRPRTSRPSST